LGLAYFVTLDRDVEGVGPSSVNGKALARAESQLRALSQTMGVPVFFTFVSAAPATWINPQEAGRAMARAQDQLDTLRAKLGMKRKRRTGWMIRVQTLIARLLSPRTPPAERWFLPGAGLSVVRKLLEVANEHSIEPAVIHDLRQIEAVLIAAEKVGARFHLSVDV
jgi:hypothetical protein